MYIKASEVSYFPIIIRIEAMSRIAWKTDFFSLRFFKVSPVRWRYRQICYC